MALSSIPGTPPRLTSPPCPPHAPRSPPRRPVDRPRRLPSTMKFMNKLGKSLGKGSSSKQSSGAAAGLDPVEERQLHHGGAKPAKPPQAAAASSAASSGASSSASRSGGRSAPSRSRRPRRAVRASAITTEDSSESYVILVVPKPDAARRLIFGAVRRNVLFRACSSDELRDLIDAFAPVRRTAGSVVIQEGDRGDGFYVLAAGGPLAVHEADAFRGTLGPGTGFGEIALLYSCPRTATVTVTDADADLWCVDRRAFRAIVARHKRKRLNVKLMLLEKVSGGERPAARCCRVRVGGASHGGWRRCRTSMRVREGGRNGERDQRPRILPSQLDRNRWRLWYGQRRMHWLAARERDGSVLCGRGCAGLGPPPRGGTGATREHASVVSGRRRRLRPRLRRGDGRRSVSTTGREPPRGAWVLPRPRSRATGG